MNLTTNINNWYNSSLTESSNMEKEASQPTSTKRRWKAPLVLDHFFPKLKDGSRPEDPMLTQGKV